MQSSAASQATISNTRTGLLRFAPVHMVLALFIAMIALGAVAGPVFAQDEATTDTAAAAEAADAPVVTASEPVDLKPLGAGIAILSIIGPALGIGILAGMSSSAIGRNPDAGEQIRSLAVLMAAFAEGLGVIALVVGLLIALI